MESSAEEQEATWIANFCQARGNEFFCQVDRNYIEDGFNLYGLKGVVENFGDCLDIILDRVEPADESDAASGGGGVAAAPAGQAPGTPGGIAGLAAHTVELYGLIHARYVVTANGLEAMHAKYSRREFGCCPRFYCENYPVLPLGLNDSLGVEKVVVYCPRCRNVFRSARAPDTVDGAYFGTTFAHLFLMTFGFPRVPADQLYVPRVFGFRLHRSAGERAARPPHAQLHQPRAIASSPQQTGHPRSLAPEPTPPTELPESATRKRQRTETTGPAPAREVRRHHPRS